MAATQIIEFSTIIMFTGMSSIYNVYLVHPSSCVYVKLIWRWKVIVVRILEGKQIYTYVFFFPCDLSLSSNTSYVDCGMQKRPVMYDHHLQWVRNLKASSSSNFEKLTLSAYSPWVSCPLRFSNIHWLQPETLYYFIKTLHTEEYLKYFTRLVVKIHL